MDICKLILNAENPLSLFAIYKHTLIEEQKNLQKKITSLMMVISSLENHDLNEIVALEERMDQINTCIMICRQKKLKENQNHSIIK